MTEKDRLENKLATLKKKLILCDEDEEQSYLDEIDQVEAAITHQIKMNQYCSESPFTGNRPCDEGAICDSCMASSIERSSK
jgi:hypothetical protein